MDVKSLISNKSSGFIDMFKEAPYSLLNGAFNVPNSCLGGKQKDDALEAVKLDPAVLEAQVTVHAKEKSRTTNGSQNVPNENKKEQDTPSHSTKGFEDMIMQHEAALLSLTPHQLQLLMQFADVLRRQRMITQRHLECAFCKNNGKPSFWYMSHALKDIRGRVRCPVLRAFRCPRCGATGDQAHTIKYCPENSLIDIQSTCS